LSTAQLPSFPALFTQSMSVLSGSGEAGDPDLIAHVVPTNQGPIINHVVPTNQGPIINHVVPTNQGPIINHVVPTNQGPIINHVVPTLLCSNTLIKGSSVSNHS
jgi:hypothetical protein